MIFIPLNYRLEMTCVCVLSPDCCWWWWIRVLDCQGWPCMPCVT